MYKKGNVSKATTIQRRRSSLLIRIQHYISSRSQYMPGLDRYLRNSPTQEDVATSTPEVIRLYLPSSIPSENRMGVCIHGLVEIEDRLRFAQAAEALQNCAANLRNVLTLVDIVSLMSHHKPILPVFKSCRSKQIRRLRRPAHAIV
jgi:hypothetical protein